MKVITTGFSGMVGSRVRELAKGIEFFDLSISHGIDIRDRDVLLRAITNEGGADALIHMAAKADVDSCENDKIFGEESDAWQINVEGTRNVVSASRGLVKKVIYISTDFVFDGTKDYYEENDEVNPVNWYGYTKLLGEEAVLEDSNFGIVARIAYPYRAKFEAKNDFVRNVIKYAKEKKDISGLTDHIFTPTFIDDIALMLLFLVKNQAEKGIYHCTGSSSLTPFEACREILDTFSIKAKLNETTRAKYFRERAFRPANLALNNRKIMRHGLKPRTFSQGLIEVKRQLE